MVMKNKKGQDLSIGTLILIVLGIVVLVLLILGFSMGWSNLWEKINIFGGGSSIGTIVNACKLAITSQDSYTFCEKTWEITLDDGSKTELGCRDDRVKGIDKRALDCTSEYEDIIFAIECDKVEGTIESEECISSTIQKQKADLTITQPVNEKYCCVNVE